MIIFVGLILIQKIQSGTVIFNQQNCPIYFGNKPFIIDLDCLLMDNWKKFFIKFCLIFPI